MTDQRPARPDLAVIDRAIELIETRQLSQTCWALFDAANKLGLYPNNNIYVQQFRAWVTGEDSHFPQWWNAPYSGPNKQRRIAALKSFRQACIDAAANRGTP